VAAISFSSIAASVYSSLNSKGETEYNSQVYSLDSSRNMNVDIYVNGQWRSTVVIPLSIPPKMKSPIAAAAWADRKNADVRITPSSKTIANS